MNIWLCIRFWDSVIIRFILLDSIKICDKPEKKMTYKLRYEAILEIIKCKGNWCPQERIHFLVSPANLTL